jgi:hypothetical protein
VHKLCSLISRWMAPARNVEVCSIFSRYLYHTQTLSDCTLRYLNWRPYSRFYTLNEYSVVKTIVWTSSIRKITKTQIRHTVVWRIAGVEKIGEHYSQEMLNSCRKFVWMKICYLKFERNLKTHVPLWAQQHMVDRHYSLNLKPWSARKFMHMQI